MANDDLKLLILNSSLYLQSAGTKSKHHSAWNLCTLLVEILTHLLWVPLPQDKSRPTPMEIIQYAGQGIPTPAPLLHRIPRILFCQPSISPSCRYHEETANKERDLITGNRREAAEFNFFFFVFASNCNQQTSEPVTGSAKLLLREQNLCLKIIRHSAHRCLL